MEEKWQTARMVLKRPHSGNAYFAFFPRKTGFAGNPDTMIRSKIGNIAKMKRLQKWRHEEHWRKVG